MPDLPSVLILTAGFGDGHNSAARSVAQALERESGGSVEAVVVDLFEDAAPVTGAFYKGIYRQMINHLPSLWALCFDKTKGGDFGCLWWDRFVGVEAALELRLARHKPQVIVLTYPVYSYFLEKISADSKPSGPIFQVVTDSITIHPIWLKGKVDRLFVTDDFSREVARAGLKQAIWSRWILDTRAQTDVLCDLCEAQNWSKVVDVAHSIKGAAAQIGAVRVSVAADRAYLAAREDPPCSFNILDTVSLLRRAFESTALVSC